jgi:hypothetical protein
MTFVEFVSAVVLIWCRLTRGIVGVNLPFCLYNWQQIILRLCLVFLWLEHLLVHNICSCIFVNLLYLYSVKFISDVNSNSTLNLVTAVSKVTVTSWGIGVLFPSEVVFISLPWCHFWKTTNWKTRNKEAR